MFKKVSRKFDLIFLGLLSGMLFLGGCESTLPLAEDATSMPETTVAEAGYLIGPLDRLNIFVWKNAELSGEFIVRPDGHFSIPLVEDIEAAYKTPTQLARDIENDLKQFIQEPIVTVIPADFLFNAHTQNIRVVGEATTPLVLPYIDKTTLLDVMISSGGVTDFADGNNSIVVRNGESLRVRLDDLVKKGDISANIAMYPGDILIIPESWF